jgi:hypothetical protein
VRTVAEMGWKSRKDADLLLEAERSFDVFVTIDRKIGRERDLSRFRLGFVIVRVPSNVIAAYKPIFGELCDAVERVKPGETAHVSAFTIQDND